MGERICSNCAHCLNNYNLYCRWEENFLPPPIQRARSFGRGNTETWEDAAKDCPHFHHRIIEEKKT